MTKKKILAFVLPVLGVVALDRITKYLVRTTPSLQSWEIIDGWLAFHYTLNPGMALGMDFFSTPVISVISILIVIAFIWYAFHTMSHAKGGFIVCMGLIVGGALGNIIDRIFLGYIQNTGGFLHGHVVDFIHFTATINGYPVFPYIFNIADSAVTVAVILLFIFHRRWLPAEQLQINDEAGSSVGHSKKVNHDIKEAE